MEYDINIAIKYNKETKAADGHQQGVAISLKREARLAQGTPELAEQKPAGQKDSCFCGPRSKSSGVGGVWKGLKL